MTAVCPKCDVELLILHFQGLEVDFCHQCRGLWLDAGELEALMTRTGATPEDPLLQSLNQSGAIPAGPKHLCPRCDEQLHEIQIPSSAPAPLTLDRCPRGHGLWFDADELQRLLGLLSPASGAGKTLEFLKEMFPTTLKP